MKVQCYYWFDALLVHFFLKVRYFLWIFLGSILPLSIAPLNVQCITLGVFSLDIVRLLLGCPLALLLLVHTRYTSGLPLKVKCYYQKVLLETVVGGCCCCCMYVCIYFIVFCIYTFLSNHWLSSFHNNIIH